MIQFDRAPSGFGTWLGGTVNAGSASTSGTNSGGYVTFDTSSNTTVQAKVGISFVSQANAQANLAAENPGFDFAGIRAAADTSWNTILNRVQVTGGAAADLQKFYTALYHVFQNPNIASDTNGQYRGFDQAIHTASHTVYQNYSGWDIYRSWAALIGLVAPAEASDIAKSMVLDGQQGGLLPKWSHNNNEHFVMTGDPGPIVVGSMYAFGVRGFDTAAALTLMDKSSNGGTAQGGSIRGRQSGYVSRHYVTEDPSDSLEYSASDFAVAQFAKAVGDTTKYNTYMQRAQWWQNVFGTDSGYIQPRGSTGTWAWPVVPSSNSGYTEGNPSQYTWMVPYNYQGLINLMGGNKTAVQRLDHHFTQLNGGLTQPYFYIGNEPEHGVPWAYNYAAHPQGTSSAVRRVMNESFTTGAGGLPGNDDLGATSAWYVFAALGMYPATPGADVLALHGPLFPAVSIIRPSGTIQINGTGAGQGCAVRAEPQRQRDRDDEVVDPLRRHRGRVDAELHDGLVGERVGHERGGRPAVVQRRVHAAGHRAGPRHEPGAGQGGDGLGGVRLVRGRGQRGRRQPGEQQQVLQHRRHEVPPGRPRVGAERVVVRRQARRPRR